VGMGPNSNSATGGPLLARDHAMTAGRIWWSPARRGGVEAYGVPDDVAVFHLKNLDDVQDV
jgi:hypothetical protein